MTLTNDNLPRFIFESERISVHLYHTI
jgi:hypothetical protein